MTKSNLYQDVTAKIIAEMEGGSLPWVKPWDIGNLPSRPVNASTDADYNGINVLLLWGRLFEQGHDVNAWLTFNQAKKMGAHVRKGERGSQIVKVVTFATEKAKAEAALSGEDPKERAALKRYTVFNVAQIEGLDPDMYAPAVVIPEPERHARIDALVEACGVQIECGGTRACYRLAADKISMPPINSFKDEASYYAVLLHELAHWTGAAHRLDAPFGMKGTHDYYREELRAELTAAFLCATFGVVPINRHSDYLSGYIAALKADPKLLFQTASAASKAAEFILGFDVETQQQRDAA